MQQVAGVVNSEIMQVFEVGKVEGSGYTPEHGAQRRAEDGDLWAPTLRFGNTASFTCHPVF